MISKNPDPLEVARARLELWKRRNAMAGHDLPEMIDQHIALNEIEAKNGADFSAEVTRLLGLI